MPKSYSQIPKVDRVLTLPGVARLLADQPKPVVLAAVRAVLDRLRSTAVNGRLAEPIDESGLDNLIRKELAVANAPSLRPVVNGTGVVIHTNLGRSLLAPAACRHLAEAAERFTNLEIDLATGERGERYCHVEGLLCELTGAEAALVVNNNAAAVLLALSCLASGREVIVSRGELVEIGGSFRIPDVMRQSGSILCEVGTTNRTHLKDYRGAITPETALLLKIHTSNFAVVGFTAEVDAAALVELGREQGITVMADIGSGSLIDLAPFGIPGETPIRDYVRAGVDVITCSGDKMLGGPQAGIILGRRAVLAELRKHPLLRALRIDKLTLAALEATLRLYRDERQALAEIPTLRMLTTPLVELKEKGRRYLRRLRRQAPATVRLSLETGSSQVGGGALPLVDLPSCLIAVEADGWQAQEIDAAFRGGAVPVVGRINRGRYLLDVRTLQECDLPALSDALARLAAPSDSNP